jgi:hypothetical protein
MAYAFPALVEYDEDTLDEAQEALVAITDVVAKSD